MSTTLPTCTTKTNLVVFPDRMFKFYKNAKEEDILGNAGGAEELRQSTIKPFRPDYDDDFYGDRGSWNT